MGDGVITKGHPAPPRVWASVGVGLKFLFAPTSYYLRLILVLGLFFVASALVCAYINPTWGILTGILGLFLWGGFNARLVRHVTLGETKVNSAGPLVRGYFWLSIVADIVQAVLAYLAMIPGFLILMVAGSALGYAFAQPSLDAFVASNPELNGLAVLFFLGSFLLILVPCYFVALRTLFLSTHVTSERGFDIETAYKITKGKVWRLLGLFFMMRVMIPVLVLGVFALLVSMGVGASLSLLLQQGVPLDQQLPHMGIPAISYVIHLFIFALVLVHGTWVVAGAHYYQGLYDVWAVPKDVTSQADSMA
ncbi:MAG: hypothetical protein ACK5TR_04200 [Alphaproteobacteria bacterium]|jgi:hypothetical protein|nr:hypothetical protein [Alphaproteobacteria bacterium]